MVYAFDRNSRKPRGRKNCDGKTFQSGKGISSQRNKSAELHVVTIIMF